MKSKESYFYELLIIDESEQTDITSVKSLLMALSYNDKLWKKPELKPNSIFDRQLDIQLDASKINTSVSEQTVFQIKVISHNPDRLDAFLTGLLKHTKNKLFFSSVKILKDGVSSKIAKQILPLISESENTLRSYISKYNIHANGIDWWQTNAPKAMVKKVAIKKDNSPLSKLIDSDFNHTNFEDITELAKNCPLNASFKNKWKTLTEVRSKVFHNHFLTSKDLTETSSLVTDLLKLIEASEKKINTIKVNIPKKTTNIVEVSNAEKKATPKTKPTTLKKKISPPVKTKKTTPEKVVKKVEPPIVTSKIEAPQQPTEINVSKPMQPEDAFKMITESELLNELRTAESSSTSFIDLKEFVNKTLVPKGYASGPTFSLARMMSGKGLVEIYDTKDASGMPVKAVKIQ